MRFMMIVRATQATEAGVMPSPELISAMTKFNQEMANAGILLDAAGLQPSSKGGRVRFSGDRPLTVVDGPFAETKELIAGYWIIDVNSKEEAIEWAKRSPNPYEGGEGEIEIRQFFGMDDFPPSDAVDEAKDFEKTFSKG
jgi:hypothetical protein